MEMEPVLIAFVCLQRNIFKLNKFSLVFQFHLLVYFSKISPLKYMPKFGSVRMYLQPVSKQVTLSLPLYLLLLLNLIFLLLPSQKTNNQRQIKQNKAKKKKYRTMLTMMALVLILPFNENGNYII